MLSHVIVGRGLAPAAVELTTIGKVVEEQLLDLPNRYPTLAIDKYVIMPTHIHIIFALNTSTAATNPTLTEVVGVFKSLSTRFCNQRDNVQGRKIWQASFYDEVIRSENMYQNVWRYIDENPDKWVEDKYFR